MGVRAIDVSRHQGPINWAAVAGDGVRGAWAKVGGADDGLYRDARAGENLAGVEAAGLELGTYYFAVPKIGDGPRQAQHAVTCGYGRGRLLPAADIETNPNRLTGLQLDQFAAAFCAEAWRLVARESIVYTNINIGIGSSYATPRCPLWIANYGANRPGTTPPHLTGSTSDGLGGPRVPPMWPAWDIWQFNDQTRVPGITKNTCDQNVVTDDLWARMTGAPTAARQKELAMNGLYGNHPNLGGAVWVLVFDGNGVPRRFGAINEAVGGVLAKAGYRDTDHELTGDELLWFASLSPTNDQGADVGALRLAGQVIGQVSKVVIDEASAVLAAVNGQVPAPLPPNFAGDVARELEADLERAVAAGLDRELDKLAD